MAIWAENPSQYLIQTTTLTSIADEVRILSGTEETLSPEAMKENLNGANSAIQEEANLIAQILLALEAKTNKTITFSINGTEYTAEKNMTWHEWCYSDYNTSYFTNYTESDRVSNADDHLAYDGEFIYGNEIIVANRAYTTIFDSTPEV